jgi:peptidoglycan/LPS O-acetylase OafA/YrhL
MDARDSTNPKPATESLAVPFGKRSMSLDGLRGVAILSVVLFHSLRVLGDTELTAQPWRALLASSWPGVDLFFVLSGFLITGILLDSRNAQGYFRNFYARRTLRIFPLYYVTLTLALLAVPAIVGTARLPALYSVLTAHQIWLWLYLQNYLQAAGPHQLPGFGHFWSLAIEEQFYWVWPLFVYAVNRKTLFRICVAICALEPILRFTLFHNGVTPWALREYTFTRVDTLLYGAIAAILFRDPELKKRGRWVIATLAVCAAAIIAGLIVANGYLPYEGFSAVVASYSSLAVLFAVLVSVCASGKGRLAKFMASPILQWFGRYSYALYIFHPAVYLAYEATIGKRVHLGPYASIALSFVIVLAISSALARISWTLLESQFLKLKRHFEYRPMLVAKDSQPAAVVQNATTQSVETEAANV